MRRLGVGPTPRCDAEATGNNTRGPGVAATSDAPWWACNPTSCLTSGNRMGTTLRPLGVETLAARDLPRAPAVPARAAGCAPAREGVASISGTQPVARALEKWQVREAGASQSSRAVRACSARNSL